METKETEDMTIRVVYNPANPKEALLFPAEGVSARADEMLHRETLQDGTLLYSVPDYATLDTMLRQTEGLKDTVDLRLCAGGLGYVKYTRTGDAALPPEGAVRKVFRSGPSLPPWVARRETSVTIQQDAEHMDGVVTGATDRVVPAETPAPLPGGGGFAPARPDPDRGGILAGAAGNAVDRFVRAYLDHGGTLAGVTGILESL